MIAVLRKSVFRSSRVPTLDLVSIFRFAVSLRHLVLVESGAVGEFERWLEERDWLIREEIREAHQESSVKATERERRRIFIDDVDEPDWDEQVFPIRRGLQLLEIPLKVVLENRYSDGAFLRFMVSGRFSNLFNKAVKNHWLELEQGGGVEEIVKRIRHLSRDHIESSRVLPVFDSDSIFPQDSSSVVKELCEMCIEEEITFHRLRRRAIENYFPKEAVRQWAWNCSESKQERRVPLFEVFLEMTDTQRAHYNFKKGLAQDEKHARWEDEQGEEVYGSLSMEAIEVLENGFGTGIASEIYDSTKVELSDDQKRRDSSRDEIREIFEKIFRLV